MPNYRLDIEYDGAAFCGWQIQPNGRTVQEDIEKALQVLLKKEVRITGAGRTDAGVHAKGQVAHFFFEKELDIKQISFGLNGILKHDIVIHKMTVAPDSFHARYSAIYRQYCYKIHLGRTAIHRDFCWELFYKVDWDLVRPLLSVLTGKHNFNAFCASNSDTQNRVCDVLFFSFESNGKEIIFHIRANRFLYKMVRSVIGTLVDIGRGQLPKENLEKSLQTGDRRLVGATAPAKGLTLEEVGYPEEFWNAG
jgi:tRNA pseudouridine38-40 synthase